MVYWTLLTGIHKYVNTASYDFQLEDMVVTTHFHPPARVRLNNLLTRRTLRWIQSVLLASASV